TDIIWISDGSDPAKVKSLEEVRCFKLKQGFIIPAQFGASSVSTTSVTANNVTTVTQNEVRERFVQDGAPLNPSIETVIEQFFEGSKYYIDRERNLIIARGTYEQLAQLKELIDQFDKPVQQVYIEARFITVSEAAFLQLGMDWSTVANSTVPVAADYTGMGLTYGLGNGLTKSWTKIFGTDDLNATLYAIEQSGESETLSSPRIVAINNLPAKISDGKVQYYYQQYTVSTTLLENKSSSQLVPSGSPTMLNSGVELSVLASIGGDGETIMLALNPVVNTDVDMVEFTSINDYDEDGKILHSFSIKLPEYKKQSLSTRVAVKSGQTVAMGGVMERKQETYSESVPILSSIPLIGNLFRKRSEIDKPRYLLVFVTATLISDSGEFVVPPQ
ncbi:MAG: type II secretion system protein GspD, partial [Verrucomicrobia bacterium]|nr:type II secretion system protein GspD [Verrucomicrobiota bacterium]